MATLSIFSTFNWFRGLQIGAGLSYLVIFLGCQNEKPKNQSKPILVDSIYFNAINACAEVYQAKYNQKVDLLPKTEKEILSAFIHDSAHLAIGSFSLSDDLISTIKNQGFSFNSEPIAFSALVGISASKIGLVFNDSLNYYVLNSDQATVKYLEKKGCKNIFGINTLPSLFEYLNKNISAIGIVNLYSLNQYKTKFGWQDSILKIMPYKTQDKITFPNQVDIANGNYPGYLPINFLLKKAQIDEEERFLKFLFQRDGQKIFQKEGLAPLLNYERNIEINKE